MEMQIPKTPPIKAKMRVGFLEFRYVFAVLMVIAALPAAFLLQFIAPPLPLSIDFFVAVVALSAGSRGIGPGILATILSAGVCDYFFLPPIHSLLLLVLFFLFVAVCINLLGERLQAGTKELVAVRDQLEALNGITAAMNASLELSIVLTTLKEQIVQYLNVPGGLIFVDTAAEDQKHLHLAESWGWIQIEEEACQSWLAETLAQETAEEALVQKAGHIAQTSCLGKLIQYGRPGWRACLIVPLIANGTIQGFLCLFDSSSLLPGQVHQAFLQALGRQVGVLIHNAQLYEQVRSGNAPLQDLSRRLVAVQEAERREIARELHDEIGQTLTGLKLGLEMGTKLPVDAARKCMQSSLGLVNELIAQVRNLSLDLRPAMLDDLGLLPTLLWHFERYTASTQVKVHFEHNEWTRRCSYEVETTAYRVVQEALTNVARHADMTEVTVRLLNAEDLLVIQVADRGSGFDWDKAFSSAATGGLVGMQERVALVGGELTIESAPGKGTCVTAELPIMETEKE